MAAEADIIRYMITGVEGEVIPENATHVSVHPSVRIITRMLFSNHPNIVELFCHDGVIKIEEEAFYGCCRLKRVIMKGVEEVERRAFKYCEALEYVEGDKLERIGRAAFLGCESMTSFKFDELEIIGAFAFSWCNSVTRFNLPSAKIVLKGAFWECELLKYVKFSKKLESFEEKVFCDCPDLEHITIPLKNGVIHHNDTFQLCENLTRVDFVEGAALQDTIQALLCDEWRKDILAEIVSINQILPNAYAVDDADDNPGRKAEVIRNWVANVLRKIIYYKSQHRRFLKEAACRLQLSLPHDIVMNNVASFLMLPQHTFDGEIEDGDGELDMRSDDEEVDESHTSRLSDEEQEDFNANEGSVGEDIDDVVEEVTGDGERRKRRKTAKTDDLHRWRE